MHPASGLAGRFPPFATIWVEMEGPSTRPLAVAAQLPAGAVSAAAEWALLPVGSVGLWHQRPCRQLTLFACLGATGVGGCVTHRDTGARLRPQENRKASALSSLARSRHSRKLAYLLGLRLQLRRGLGLVLGLGFVENLDDCTRALRLLHRFGARVLGRMHRGRAMQVSSEQDAEVAPADQHHRCRTYSPSSRPGRGATLASDTPQDSSPAAYPLRIGRDSGPQRTHTRQGFRPAW